MMTTASALPALARPTGTAHRLPAGPAGQQDSPSSRAPAPVERGISVCRGRDTEIPASRAVRTYRLETRRSHTWLWKLALVLGGVILSAASLRADIVVSLYTAGDLASTTVSAGSTLALYTSLSTTPAQGVGGLFYTIECPNTNWAIFDRDYAYYGWYHNDGLFDLSTPVPATSSFPVAITDGLFASTPGTADFTLNTSLDPAGTTMASGTVETFSLVVPSTPGVYTLNFGTLDALAGNGDALTGEVAHGFTVTVEGVVPEPGALALLGLAGAALAGRRRRRQRL